MMQRRLMVVGLLIAMVPALALAQGVADTKHNFSSATASPNAYFWGTRQVCIFCHTPHNSSTSGPLWNHETNLSQSYTMYTSDTMDMLQSAAPREPSLLCLSCHDGAIAVNSLNNVPGPEGAGTYGSPGGAGLDGSGRLTTASAAYVGTDLRNDHPVGLTYDSTRDNAFHPRTGNDTLYPDRLLYLGLYVECTSCHNPHDNSNTNFLVESNAGSALCTRCHDK